MLSGPSALAFLLGVVDAPLLARVQPPHRLLFYLFTKTYLQ